MFVLTETFKRRFFPRRAAGPAGAVSMAAPAEARPPRRALSGALGPAPHARRWRGRTSLVQKKPTNKNTKKTPPPYSYSVRRVSATVANDVSQIERTNGKQHLGASRGARRAGAEARPWSRRVRDAGPGTSGERGRSWCRQRPPFHVLTPQVSSTDGRGQEGMALRAMGAARKPPRRAPAGPHRSGHTARAGGGRAVRDGALAAPP